MRLHVPGVTVFSLFVVAALALLVKVLASINRQWAGPVVQKRRSAYGPFLARRGADADEDCCYERLPLLTRTPGYPQESGVQAFRPGKLSSRIYCILDFERL